MIIYNVFRYWRGLTFNPPLYGADVQGSLYDKDVKVRSHVKLKLSTGWQMICGLDFDRNLKPSGFGV